MKAIHMIAFTLLIIGGLNWLFVGVWGWDIGQWFGGMTSQTSRVIYTLVGVSAILEILTHKKNCRCCTANGSM